MITPKTARKMLTIDEASRVLGVSKDTLRRWEKQDKLPSFRTDGGHRRYDIEDLKNARNIRYSHKSVAQVSQQPEIFSNFKSEIPQLYDGLHLEQKRILKFVFVTILGLICIGLLTLVKPNT